MTDERAARLKEINKELLKLGEELADIFEAEQNDFAHLPKALEGSEFYDDCEEIVDDFRDALVYLDYAIDGIEKISE